MIFVVVLAFVLLIVIPYPELVEGEESAVALASGIGQGFSLGISTHPTMGLFSP